MQTNSSPPNCTKQIALPVAPPFVIWWIQALSKHSSAKTNSFPLCSGQVRLGRGIRAYPNPGVPLICSGWNWASFGGSLASAAFALTSPASTRASFQQALEAGGHRWPPCGYRRCRRKQLNEGWLGTLLAENFLGTPSGGLRLFGSEYPWKSTSNATFGRSQKGDPNGRFGKYFRQLCMSCPFFDRRAPIAQPSN